VEASVELRLFGLPPGYPQVFVRVQSDTVATLDTLDGYILFVNDSATQAILARQSGTSYITPLATLNLAPGLNATDTFRLRLSAVGTNPVVLNAYVERLNGSTWEAIGTAAYNDTSGARIDSTGSVGFGGYVEANYAYDNFTRTDQGGG